ncbi:MAG: hypothetical protein ACR2FY_12860 [Pirellulaceae bacterium]
MPAEVFSPLADPPVVPVDPPPALNAAPVISNFTFTYEGNCILIQGFVTDDQDPTGYAVSISGLLNLQLTVDANDWFSYSYEVTPEFSGTIFSQTQDAGGLFSNIAFITV